MRSRYPQLDACLRTDQVVYLKRDVSDVDAFDRLLRYVYAADGVWVNGVPVREGYAPAKEYPPDVRCADQLAALERQAQRDALGGWAECGW